MRRQFTTQWPATLAACSTSSCTSRRSRRTPATSSACAPTRGARLHLIEPLGFDIDEKAVRRAGMDYAELADVQVWRVAARECMAALGQPRWFAISTRGATRYDSAQLRGRRCVRVRAGDARACRRRCSRRVRRTQRLRIPMRPGNRSLNLSNAARSWSTKRGGSSDFRVV